MRFVVDMVYLLFAVGISPIVVYRVIKHKRYRKGWAQRFGKIKRRFPHKKCIWLHAVSVGEVNAAKTLVGELANRFSDFEIVISSTTDTGFARAMSLFGERFEVFYFPFDLSWAMRRAFDRIRPSLCLLLELEVWPNFVQIAQQLNTPIIVVNGRISDGSFAHYKRIRPLLSKTFGKLSLVLVQTDEYARRFKELGCPSGRVIVTGSLKYDTAQITDRVDGSDVLEAQLDIGRERLWVAGATGNDEEAILLDVYLSLKKQEQFRDVRLAIVPRKPERFDEVAQLIEQSGFSVVRYSQIKNKSASKQQEQPAMDKKLSIINNQLSIGVVLGDTMGDLRKFYSLATIVFVGRSLVPMGGSDMMEAAALGKCTIFGPHAFNFKQTVDALLKDHGAIMVQDQQHLLETIQKCLTEPDYSQKIAQNGQEVIRKNQGATIKTLEHIEKHPMKLYFAYGSNMWRKQMKNRCPNHQEIGHGLLKGYRWIVSERGYANIIKSTLDKVYGVVYKISKSDEDNLDRYEGVEGGGYEKKMLIIKVNEHTRQCLVYIDPREEEGSVKEEYIERINKGIRDSTLPNEYVNHIRKFIPP